MKAKLTFCTLVLILASGCVSYSAIKPGEIDYSGLKVKTSQAWNMAPKEATPLSRADSRTWTQDGVLLDRIVIIPGVPDGEALFKAASRDQALPVFKADMLPNEIEELTESSIVKLFGEGDVAVETANLRPHKYGENKGFMFDMSVTVSDGPNYKGITGAFVVAERLHLIMFLGAVPFYFEKHLDEALVIIKGAHV
ncbi:hypothetical protein ACFL1S_01240 [Pseudomonadota bacterium]